MSIRSLLNTTTGKISEGYLPDHITENDKLFVYQSIVLAEGIVQGGFTGYQSLANVTIPSSWLSNYSHIKETITITFHNVKVTQELGANAIPPTLTINSYLTNTITGNNTPLLIYTSGTVFINNVIQINGELDTDVNNPNYFSGTVCAEDYFPTSSLPTTLPQKIFFKILQDKTPAGLVFEGLIPDVQPGGGAGIISRTFTPLNI